MFDLIIRNGLLIDGTGGPARPGDLAVQQGRIAALGDLARAEAALSIDAGGHVVTPGFIDMHSHADGVLPALPTADSLVRQGITSAVVGQCGESPAPLLPATREEVVASMASADCPLPFDAWSTFAEYLEYLGRLGISINVTPLVGQGTVRAGVMAHSAASPNDEQVAAMRREVARAMDGGAIGVSTGLIYPPGSYATTEEIVETVRPAGERGGYYFSHIRGEADRLLEAVAEAIHIGRETGAAVEISHFKAAGRANWDKAERALDLIDRARAEGLDVAADMYPYLSGSSSLVSMLPEWAQEGGVPAILARLADPETRRSMSHDMDRIGFFRGAEWDQVLIAGAPARREVEGRYVADLAAEVGLSPHEWVFETLAACRLDVQMISRYACEENLERQLRRPWMAIGTDAGGRSTQGPLSAGFPHPRNYGTFPRILARYVRERPVLTLEAAIHRMTGLAAERLRWRDRGLLKKGYAADIVVLDPDTVTDTATYEAPHRYPVGIEHVIVNGRPVVAGGRHTGARPGRVLARGEA